MNNNMGKLRKIEQYEIECDHCQATIKTNKTSGKVQCFLCKKRTEI